LKKYIFSGIGSGGHVLHGAGATEIEEKSHSPIHHYSFARLCVCLIYNAREGKFIAKKTSRALISDWGTLYALI
jgi:hypothetical protein